MKREKYIIANLLAGFALTACVVVGMRPIPAEGCADVLKHPVKSVQLVSANENKIPTPQVIKGSPDLLGDMLAAANADNFPVHKAGAMRPAAVSRFPKLLYTLGR